MPQHDRPGKVPACAEAVNDDRPASADGALVQAGSGHTGSRILPGRV